MASQFAYDLVHQRLAAGFAAAYPIFDWEDVAVSAPQRADPFLALEDVPGSFEEAFCIGTVTDATQREEGDLIVHAFARASNGGPPACRRLIEQARDHMRRVVLAPELYLRVTSAPERGQIYHGLWTNYYFSVRYERIFTAALMP